MSALIASLSAAGCGKTTPPATDDRTLAVYADTSLATPFTTLAATYEKSHPGRHIVLTFAAASELADRVGGGAPADIYAGAGTETMTPVLRAGLTATGAREIARNPLVIAVPDGNPDKLRAPADLGRRGLLTARCAAPSPCAALTDKALAAAAVTLAKSSLEPSSNAALTRLNLGEVDAALVYRSYAAAARDVTIIEFPAASRRSTPYSVVWLSRTRHPTEAAAFVDYLTGDKAHTALRAAGFEPG